MKLPTPDQAAQEQSAALCKLIQQEILAAGGQISFAHFMQMALYTPQLGYYHSNANKFGRAGDFITAPEISPLFARCLAKQCQQILKELQSPNILEIGAGSGVLAKDLLLELEKLNNLPEYYYIFEISPALREQQQELLKQHCSHLSTQILWLDDLLPEFFSGVVLANEVMDALPFNRFKLENTEIYEQTVTFENEIFKWKNHKPSANFLQTVQTIQTECEPPTPYESEINLSLPTWIKTLSHTLKVGAILLFDYGYGRREYYHPERDHGTLTCFYQHHQHANPFVNIGLQDITAHVDFTAVVESGVDADLTFSGFTTQAAFLFACGLLELANPSLPPIKEVQQNQAIKTLTLPSEMGEVIKVMGFTKNLEISLLGFSMQERSRDL